MHKESRIGIQYEYTEDFRALGLADNPTVREVEAAFAGMKQITPEIEQAYRRISAFITSREQTPEILAVKVHFERSIREMLSAFLLNDISEMILQYLKFSDYIEHINNVFLSGDLREIKAAMGCDPTLAHYRNSARKTPLDIAFNERKLHPEIVQYLIGEEVKLSDLESHIAEGKPYSSELDKCINCYINAPIFISTSLLGKQFPALVVQIINGYRGNESLTSWLQSGMELISVVKDNWPTGKSDWEKANDLMDKGADIYTERMIFLGSGKGLIVNTWRDSFYEAFLLPSGMRSFPEMSELKVRFYEKVFLHAQESFTLFLLRKLIAGFKHLRRDEYVRNIEKLFNILIKAKQDIFDIFMFAVKYNNMAIIQNITSSGLLNKIEINRKDDSNQTALQLAVTYGSDEIIRFVLEMKADINTVNQAAVPRADRENVHKMRLESKRDGFRILLAPPPESYKSLSFEGRSVLHAAIWRIVHKHRLEPQVISTLLEFKADVNLKDRKGQTPLYLAATSEDPSLFELFLKHDNEQLFEKFRQNYTPSFLGGLFGMGLKGRMKSSGEEKISTMSGVLDFLKKKEKEGKPDTHAHQAIEQLQQQIARNYR